MPDGRSHFLVVAVSLAASVAGVVGYIFAGPELAATAMVATLLGELLLSPDLDHNSGATSYRLWGIFRWIWIPYQRLVKHRSWSHWPIVGTIGRLAYLAIIPAIVVSLKGEWTNVWWLLHYYRDYVIAGVAGVEISALVHIAADRW